MKNLGIFYCCAVLVSVLASFYSFYSQKYMFGAYYIYLPFEAIGIQQKRQNSLFSWKLYSSTVRRAINKRWNIEGVINTIKKKHGRIGSGGDIAMQRVWPLSRDEKDRGISHGSVWGKTPSGEGNSICKDTESGTKKKSHSWVESEEQGRMYSEHEVRKVTGSPWPVSPLQGLELHGKWPITGEIWPALCFRRVTPSAVLRMDWKGAWVKTKRPDKK